MVLGSLYSFYALFSTDINEVLYGLLAALFGWTLWGLLAPKFVTGKE